MPGRRRRRLAQPLQLRDPPPLRHLGMTRRQFGASDAGDFMINLLVRKRSVAVAEEVARRVRAAGYGVETEHPHIDRPILR